jgi:tRNA-specific 2-thiouridylase
MKHKIAIALSGGVDSAVAAYLLQQDGHELVGIYMKNWSDSAGLALGACPWVEDRRDAIAVAAQLGIPFKTVDFRDEYRERVYDYFVAEYRAGRTPNPDVLCNNLIKFDLLREYAKELGAQKLATGHYARLTRDGNSIQLREAIDPTKDQSYFLHRLSQEQLSDALFPLGELPKSEVRCIAMQARLPNADKKDSQGLCFIGKVNLREFLEQEIAPREGKIYDTMGNEVGTHPGATYFTVGQRRGLGVAAGKPVYVIATDVESNTVTTGTHDELLRDEVMLREIHWIAEQPEFPLRCQAQIRYHGKKVDAELGVDGILHLYEPQEAIAAGQFAVLFRGDEVLGGGVMEPAIIFGNVTT